MKELTAHQQMPAQDFLALGLRDLAYIKAASVEDGEAARTIYEIHSADGTVVGAAPSRELAIVAVRQSGLEPLSAH
jgi:hypothetical protein